MKMFDICGTLYDSNTTMDFCKFLSKGLSKVTLNIFTSFPGKILNKLSLSFFSYELTRNLHIKRLRGFSKEELEKAAIAFVKQELNFKKIDQSHTYLEEFKKEDILLITATIDPVAKAIAHELGGVKYISTLLDYNNDKCTGKISVDLLGDKHNYVKDLEVDFIITDNKSDLELCILAREVVVISKRKNLTFWNNSSLRNFKIIEV